MLRNPRNQNANFWVWLRGRAERGVTEDDLVARRIQHHAAVYVVIDVDNLDGNVVLVAFGTPERAEIDLQVFDPLLVQFLLRGRAGMCG